MNLPVRSSARRRMRLRGVWSRRRGAVSRMVPVVIVLAGALVVWFLFGRQQIVHVGSDESAAQDALKQCGMIVITDPTRHCTTAIHCRNKNLDEAALAQIATLSQLSSIVLADTNVTDDQLRYLADLRELASLSLSGTSVGDAGLAHLAGLRRLQALFLLGTKVTDEGCKKLGNMASLKNLDLSRTTVSDRGLESLVGLPDLTCLTLSETDVTDEGLRQLETMPRLSRVALTGARGVTPKGVERLKAANPTLTVDF